MALPFVSIIPKPKEGYSFASILNIVFFLSLGLIIASVTAFFLLNNSVKTAAESLAGQEKALLSQRTREQLELEKTVFDFQKKIKDFNALFASHRFSSNVFGFLEKLTHPKIWFSDSVIDFQSGEITLIGEAGGSQDLAEQILIFKGEENIDNVNLHNINLKSDGKVGFTADLVLNSQVFSPDFQQVTEVK